MQWAARSIPAQRSGRRGARASASSRRCPSTRRGSRRSSRRIEPGKTRRTPRAPVDSTAVRRRSTIDSAVASETPAASYVFPAQGTESTRAGGSTAGRQTVACRPSNAARPAIGPFGAPRRRIRSRGPGREGDSHSGGRTRPGDAVSREAFGSEERDVPLPCTSAPRRRKSRAPGRRSREASARADHRSRLAEGRRSRRRSTVTRSASTV